MKRRAWTTAEDALLTQRYATRSAAECAAELGRSVSSVQQRVHVLGLAKSAEWIAERTRQRWAEGRHERSRKAQFRAGQAAWNKGVPQVEWMPADARCRTEATRFKPGELTGAARHNYQPVGSLRITRDGQLQRKVTDDPTLYPARRWVSVARLVWKAANGPVPAGHAVAFRDGRTTTVETEITLDRLELVTRAELMRRNSRHTRYPPELNQLIQLKGALNRKINRRAKAQEEHA